VGARPQFELQHIEDASALEPPGIFPVLYRPWQFQASRRRFLGLCLSLTGALLLDWPSIVEGQEPTDGAGGGRVDPELLSMAGIAATQADGIERGYHLRWFCDLPFPEEAFPEKKLLEDFLKSSSPKPLAFVGRAEGSVKGKDTNPGVPWAFTLYRRAHYEHYDYKIVFAERSFPSGSRRVAISNVVFALEDVRLPEHLSQSPAEVRSAMAGIRNGQSLRITFQQPHGKGTRPVHFVKLTMQSSERRPRFVVRSYSREKDEPAREEIARWQSERGNAIAIVRYTQGHYTSLELVGERMPDIALEYSYMDEDLLIAGTNKKKRPPWQVIARVPFITAFRTWEAARSFFFRYPVANRYVDLEGAGADWSSRLNFKYLPLFPQLQQAFLRLREAQLLNETHVPATSDDPVQVVESDPRFMYQFWSLDPIVATLFSQKYTNQVGVHDPSEATEGANYDYMVETAWGTKLQRFYYIAQNISPATSPPVLPPRDLKAEQVDGRYREGNDTYYRGVLQWSPPQSPIDSAVCEPAVFDVRRQRSDGQYDVITHRVLDPNQSDPEKRFLDSPVQGTVSPPDLADPGVVSTLTAAQRAAREAEQVLQSQNSAAMITAEQMEAFSEMSTLPITQFFGTKVVPEFTEWLNVPTFADSILTNYQVRSIDLFGRTSAWQGDAPLTLTHRDPLPMATDVRVERTGNSLEISWIVDAEQIWSDRAANHFRVLWRIENGDRQFLEVAYYDLLARAATVAEYASQAGRLRDGTVTRHALIAELATSTEYQARNGTDDSSFVTAIYRDLFRRPVTSSELSAGRAQLGAGTTRHSFVRTMLTSEQYRAGDSRRFALWNNSGLARTDPAVSAEVSYRPPLTTSVQQVSDFSGTTIYGRVLDGLRDLVARETAQAIAEERVLLGGNSRIVTVSTDQALYSALPFIDVPGRYGAASTLPADFVDQVQLTIAGTNYPVVGIQRGERLKLSVVITASTSAAAADPVRVLKTAMGPRRDFSLRFGTTKSTITWTQRLQSNDFPELATDEELSEAPTAGDRANAMLERPSIQIRTSVLPEITGHESWMEERPWLRYVYGGDEYRVPVVELERISIDRAALHFGSIQRGTTADKQFVVLTNSAETELVVRRVTVSPGVFSVDPISNNVKLGAGGELRVSVDYTPTSAVANEGQLMLVTERGSIPVQLTGRGVTSQRDVTSDPRVGAARHFLAGLTLGSVLTEGEGGGEETWTPVFPGAMLLQALQTGIAGTSFRLELPPVKFVQLADIRTNDTTDAARRLASTRRAQLSFVVTMSDGTPRRYLADVLSRPWGPPGQRMGFLIRAASALPNAAKVPVSNQSCIFNPKYVETFAVPTTLLGNDQPRTMISVAISTHKNAPGTPYSSEELDSLVSVPEKLELPASTPPSPAIPVTGACGTGVPAVDPIVTVLCGMPRIFDNNKVVQARLDLGDAQIMGGSPMSISGDNYWELYRASFDALRLSFFATPRAGQPTRLQFEQMSPIEQYCLLVARLRDDWGNSTYSLQAAFARVAAIRNPVFIDEFDGLAPTMFFYAMRAARPGAQGASLVLLPFKVVIPDTSPPPPPKIVAVTGGDGTTSLQWAPDPVSSVDAYEIFYSPSLENAADVRLMGPLAKLYANRARLPSGGREVQYTGNLLRRAVERLEAKAATGGRSTVDMRFPLTALGIPAVSAIAGVYADEDLPKPDAFVGHDFANDPLNGWRSGSTVSADRRRLESIAVSPAKRVSIVYTDSNGVHRVLDSIAYYRANLDGLTDASISSISALLPRIKLRVRGGVVHFGAGANIHGIATGGQIRGVYREQTDERQPLDGAYGSSTAVNHWTSASTLSADGARLTGIVLPNGTPIVLEVADASGVVQAIREMLGAGHAALTDPDVRGLLIDPPGTSRATDPATISRGLAAESGGSPVLRLLASNLDAIIDGHQISVWIRYGNPSILLNAPPILQYVDSRAPYLWHYRIRSERVVVYSDGQGFVRSEPTAILSSRISDSTPPPVPAVTATPGRAADTNAPIITLSWMTETTRLYDVQRKDAKFPRFTSKTAWLTEDVGIFVDSAVTPGTSYTYRMRARSSSGVVAVSDSAFYVTVSAPARV
jgi:hypothetical protein